MPAVLPGAALGPAPHVDLRNGRHLIWVPHLLVTVTPLCRWQLVGQALPQRTPSAPEKGETSPI